MAFILNIDTSSAHCSVALAKAGEIVLGYESSNTMDHSSSLAPFVEKCLTFLREEKEKLDAVSVSNGPGSYTGLRIGLSMAKGIAFGFEIPLITLSTLEIMAVRAIFTYHDFSGDELIIPMIDARRMEVYTGCFDSSLNPIVKESAIILNDQTFKNFENQNKIIFIGDGTEKFRNLYKATNSVWLGNKMAHAKFMAPLSEKYFKEQKFSDVAYTTPYYLKEYQTTTPKNKL